ncbi:aquaporin-like isoform X1 [Vespa mandarinia]|uniref:aquaporin-like isoform X1 n=1 Tax=Vespa mandarinia TaxID=7446 RepID=UPI001607217D|nr:aquaporin-like isoform X1 [Vespa mandarinia]XP_035737459.1 aquaporin-like isoform X1 [Vespa mandarinia]XP_035737460.1 aquaporin-like isoform X1 [Vespa mandarinia]XP_046817030.1 aquaporin-like isoform X1 [Vespa crabro]XP_046817032.1 aquaporin-like isoform X1 [Vespa crabro]XP_047351808.1 aquaporin-like isoform X1 [Vespa velutina]
MEQGGISIISPPGITENSIGKPTKNIGLALRSNAGIRSAKEKLKAPWLKNLIKEEKSIYETIMVLLGEIIGTAILVFIGCLSCVGSMGIVPPLYQISMSFGIAVTIAIQCVGHISGAHINPSITVASLILGLKSLPMTGLYIFAQCLGGVFGYGLLKAITPSGMLHGGNPEDTISFCKTDLHQNISVFQGLLSEIIATGILVFFACGVWDPRNEKNSDSVPLRFGFCVTVLCFVFIPYTGCSLNPARSIAPAIWNGYWKNHWVFWIGPISGAIISSILYRCLFLPTIKKNEDNQNTLTGIET